MFLVGCQTQMGSTPHVEQVKTEKGTILFVLYPNRDYEVFLVSEDGIGVPRIASREERKE